MSINRRLLYLILLFSLDHSVGGLSIHTTSYDAHTNSLESSENQTIGNATNPVIYTKLRHDANNLQVFRKYQLEKTHQERSKKLKLNETFDDNSTKEISYSYYENTAIEAASINQDDLILEALDRTYKTRLVPVYMHNYDNPKDRATASDPSITSASKCERELNYLMDKLMLLEEARRNRRNLSIGPELAAFFDSFAGEEPGLLFGNYHWTGNWRQCYKRLVFDLDRSNASNTIAFRGRYCTANIRSRFWDERIMEKTKELKVKQYFYDSDQQYNYARFFRIQVGFCLPESCDSRIIDTRRTDIYHLALHKLNEPFKSYDLVDLYCLPDETSKFRRIEPMGWLFIALASFWCSMIILATYFDYKASSKQSSNSNKKTQTSTKTSTKTEQAAARRQKSNSEKLICALSLIKNYHRLTETRSLTSAPAVSTQRKTPEESGKGTPKSITMDPAPNDLLFLNAYKVISMPLIIYGHVGMLSVHLNRFPLDYESFGNDALFHFSSSTVFFVDWYFVTTGFLTSYIMFATKKVERNKLIDWIYSIVHRYWRLAPLYILLFWFQKYLFQHLSHGPVWDYASSNMTIRSVCRGESWLWPLFLVSNLHPIHQECIMPSWYISNDMQFYIITPLILVCLLKWPKGTWIGTLGLIGASISARIHRYMTDPKAQPLELIRPGFDLYMRNNWDMYPTYIYPHYRIPSHLIGLLAGHYAYKVLKGEWTSPLYKATCLVKRAYSKNENAPGKSVLGKLVWIIGFQIVLYMAFATWPLKDFFPRSLEPQVKYFCASIYGFSHSTAALGMALMFLSLTFGHFACIRRFLTLPIWTLISRVNYIVFLTQVEIIYWVYQSGERVPDFSGREAFKYWLQLVLLCYSISTVLTLWIELPLAYLEREYLGSWMAARSKTHIAIPKQSKIYLRPNRSQKSQQCEMVTRSETSQLVGESEHQPSKSAK